MKLNTFAAAAVGMLLAGSALADPTTQDLQEESPQVRCEKRGLAPGSETYENCVYVLSKLKRGEEFLKVDSFAKCFDSVFWATRCIAWYGRDAARETIDEQAIEGFNALMRARLEAEESCRAKLGKEEISNADMARCIAAESRERYDALGVSENTIESFDTAVAKSKKLFDDAQSKGWELYEIGKESLNQWWGSSDGPNRDKGRRHDR